MVVASVSPRLQRQSKDCAREGEGEVVIGDYGSWQSDVREENLSSSDCGKVTFATLKKEQEK